ncbi:hypothetical protein [Humibacillus xanthopallidus]|uniref:Dolichyl-phosphate-mannose-protein mannosyltransferase n=1 Tax=Humibacillus xanthopallidus TaxID=412689 RepID=A0A543I059_9MICO|nr:hypothetical protein [Humibacillus xanthopallidus]TQM63972.1 hypothetical protein FBY41_0329 [Humibacillus xanthopallidus]
MTARQTESAASSGQPTAPEQPTSAGQPTSPEQPTTAPEGSGHGLSGGSVAAMTGIVLVWLVTLPRMVPSLFGDHGSYVSMAERLLAGDRLYVDVVDNKGPLFYAELAAGRLVSPYADIAIEIAWVIIACLAVRSLARAAGVGCVVGLVVAFAGVPVVVTGNAYGPGMTHLPGVALCLAVAALAVRRRWVVAGLLTGVLLLSKEIMVPIAVAAILTAAWHRRTWLGVARAAASSVLLAAAVLVVMWVRGELGAFVDILVSNVQYADGSLSQSRYGSFVGHLLNAIPEDGRGGGLITISAVLLALLAVGRRRDQHGPDDAEDAGAAPVVSKELVWDLTAATLVAAILVIGASGQWAHHSQSLYVAGCLALVLVAFRLSQAVAAGDHADSPAPPGSLASRQPWRAVGIVVLAAFITGGTLHPYYYLESARELPSRVAALGRTSVESVVLDQQPKVRTYARAGANDDGAHAVGLRSLDLVCPRFHHYSFEGKAVFDKIYACLPRADALIVDQNIRDEVDRPEWNAYVAEVRRLVSTGYTCVPTSRSQVCIKRDLYVAPSPTPAG